MGDKLKKGKKKALRREFAMEIKKTRNRFLSIFFISALGAAFFAGIRSTPGDMKYSADTFYDDTNLMDLRVVGTLGMTQHDAEALKNLPDVENADPMYQSDVLYEDGNSELILRLLSLSDDMNGYHIVAGRLPEQYDECLADPVFLAASGKSVGDTVTVSSGTKDEITDTLIVDTFTIVGSGTSPLYMAFDRGTGNVGSGKVSAYLAVPEESFCLEAYTDLYITAKGAKDLNSYSEDYSALIAEVSEQVEAMEQERCLIRYDEVLEDPRQELADAKAELADKEAEAGQELADAREKLSGAQRKLSDGRADYEDGRRELEDAKKEIAENEEKLTDARKQLDDGRRELADGKRQLEDAKQELARKETEFADAKRDYEAGLAEYEKNQTQYDTAAAALAEQEQEAAAGRDNLTAGRQKAAEGRKSIEEQKALLEPVKDRMPDQWAQLLVAEKELEATETVLAETERQLTIAEEQLKGGREELEKNQALLLKAKETFDEANEKLADGERQIAEAGSRIADSEAVLSKEEKKLEEAEQEYGRGAAELADAKETIAENEKKLADAEKELADGEKELADAQKEYDDSKKEADEKIADAKQELADAEEELGKVEVPEWYVFDRDDITSVYDFGQDSDRIAAIGEVFPVMFFLVAALVSLTTMARMVDEERVQIGTLKALGYSGRDIARKYILYGFLASLGGSIFGVLVGEWLFPFVIATTYSGIVYTGLPAVYTPLNLYYAVLASLITTACTVAVTYYACIHELKAQPASLMRPAAPKSGRRVFLERLPFLWKRFNFTWKSTIRNLLRYKKRFFMTVFGIGGCMALLMVGFGIKDSIGVMAKLQYAKLWYQDAMITLNTKADVDEADALFSDLSSDSRIRSVLKAKYQTGDMVFGDKKRAVTNIILDDGNVDEFFCFRDLDTKERFRLTDDGIILTEKAARLLGVEAGDTVTFQNGNETGIQVMITAVTEHYIQHYSFMTRTLYERLYGEVPEYNQCLLVLNTDDRQTQGENDAVEKALAKDILDHDGAALSISFTGQFQEKIDHMLNGLNIVVYVLIAAAGMLAFVVLYNLNNININERKRELATLKVLGFFDQETAVYVYRENVLLTVIGTIFGMGLGVLLHRFVMKTVEVDLVMFGRTIFPVSFLYSTLLTFGFSAFICLVMYKKIKKIDMVESLKSVE